MVEPHNRGIEPYEGLNERQHRMIEEDLPEMLLEVCDICRWDPMHQPKWTHGTLSTVREGHIWDSDESGWDLFKERGDKIVLRSDRNLPIR